MRAASKCLCGTDADDTATFPHQEALIKVLEAAWTQLHGAAQDHFHEDLRAPVGMTVVRPAHGRQNLFIQHMDRQAKDCMGAAKRKDYEGAVLLDTALFAVMRDAKLAAEWCAEERAGGQPVD